MKREGDIKTGDTVYNHLTARLGSPVLSNPIGTALTVEDDTVLVRWQTGVEERVARKSLRAI